MTAFGGGGIPLLQPRLPARVPTAGAASGASGEMHVDARPLRILQSAVEVRGHEVGELDASQILICLNAHAHSTGQPEWPEALIRLDAPAPGIAHLVPHPMGDQVYLSLRFYLFGDQADAAAARAEPEWQAWLKARFPMAAEPAMAG